MLLNPNKDLKQDTKHHQKKKKKRLQKIWTEIFKAK